jgi:hypothetical protein
MIKQELYYGLVNAHHQHMVNIRSFVISGISNLNAPMLVQANTDTNSSVPATTLKEIILNAKVPGTNTEKFSSMESTSYSETDGRYLLLTDKKKLRAAEQHMIDELIEYIHTTNPDITAATTILGEEIRRANWVNVTKIIFWVQRFSCNQGPPPNGHYEPIQQCSTMAQRRESTPLDFTTDNFPVLNQKKKVRFDLQESDTSTTERVYRS